MSNWFLNEHSLWCPSCGDRVARDVDADEFVEPEACRQCGFPDAESVADYHFGSDDDEPDEEPYFDCGMMPDGTCQLAGTEECDWECPRS